MDPLSLLFAFFPEFAPYLAYAVASAAFASMFMPAPVRPTGFYAAAHRVVNALGANMRHARNAATPGSLDAAAATLGLGPVGSGFGATRGFALGDSDWRNPKPAAPGTAGPPATFTGGQSSVVRPARDIGDAFRNGVTGFALGVALAQVGRGDTGAAAEPEPASPPMEAPSSAPAGESD